MQFYDNLEKYMKIKNITAYQIAKNTSMSNATMSNWKQGKAPSADKLIELLQYLEISADDLLGTKFGKNLTEEEEQLLYYFRNCNPESKTIILNAAKGMQKEPESSKSLDSKIG